MLLFYDLGALSQLGLTSLPSESAAIMEKQAQDHVCIKERIMTAAE